MLQHAISQWVFALKDPSSHIPPRPVPFKQPQVRDWLRVIASNKDRNVYELRYFNIAANEEGEDDE